MGRYFGPSGTEEFQYPPIMRLIGTKVTQGWECSEVDNVKMRTNLMRVCMCVCVRARTCLDCLLCEGFKVEKLLYNRN